MSRQKMALIAGAVAVMLVAVLMLRGGGKREGAQRPPPIVAVERRNLEIIAEASGLVEPVRVVEVKSRASGEVLRVNVDTGDLVKQGTLLAEIDPRDVQNALAQAQADVESARVQRETADANRKRMEELRKSGAATQQEYENAVQGSAAAKASVVRAETNLELARERRGDVALRAAIDGTILQRNVQPGGIIASATANVSGGTTLFTMADLAEMQVRAKVDETDIGQVSPGQAANVTVEAYPGRIFQGTIFKIEPQAIVEQNVTMFPVLVRLQNKENLLRPGMNAEVKVRIASRQGVVAVPNTAVVSMREARAAATVLGLDESALRNADRSGSPAASDASTPVAAASPECKQLSDQVRQAGGPTSLSEVQRVAFQVCREQFRAERGGSAAPDAAPAPAAGDRRPAYVFVQALEGPAPRRVVLGLSDWEYTEVLEGLESGEKVVVMSLAKLRRDQQDMTERIRQRTGGGLMQSGGSGGARQGGGVR